MDASLLQRLRPNATGNQPQAIANVAGYAGALAGRLRNLADSIEGTRDAPTLYHQCAEALVEATIAARDAGQPVLTALPAHAPRQNQCMRAAVEAAYQLGTLATEQKRVLSKG